MTGGHMRYQRGEVVTIRDLFRSQVWFAWPAVVHEDSEAGLLLAQLPGAVGRVPEGYPDDPERFFAQVREKRCSVVPLEWRWTRCLHVFPDEAAWWSVRLMWSADSGEFLCWYVDFRRPVVRRGHLVDTRDLALDVVVAPDGEWSWKDEDQYRSLVASGFIGSEEREGVEASREVVLEAIAARRFPFDDSLLDARLPQPEHAPALDQEWASISG